MADIREKIEQIRQAIFGKDVRESIASGIEAINDEVESTTERQTTLETEMANVKRDAEEAAGRANTAAGNAEEIVNALSVWEEYDPDKEYVPMNKVVYQGNCYINIAACEGIIPTNASYWLKIASKGDQGDPGPMPTIIVGNTTTLSPGSAATVTRRDGSPDEAPILDFGIPRGADGSGTGDMSKAIYDDDDDGKVNAADIADTVPDNTITDAKLSDGEGQIKARLAAHMADNVNHVAYGTASGTNAKTISLSPAPSAYVDGMALAFKNVTENTGAVTINVNGLGAKSILKSNGSALTSGNLKANSIYTIRYNGSNFILQGEGGDERQGDNVALALSRTGTTIKLRAPGGVYDGVDDTVTHTDVNDIPENIRQGVTIRGLTGTCVPLTTEKKWANGTFSNSNSSLTVSGLTFVPVFVRLYISNGGGINYYCSRSFGITTESIGLSITSSGGTSTCGVSWTSNGFTIQHYKNGAEGFWEAYA